jgi:pimeloyl-ACP methyl ester carboxylesterase
MARFVLVHGGFSGAWIWLPLMDRLKADGHVVDAFDLPGMGNDHTSTSEVSLDSYAGRVCEVLAASSEPAVVVGHSMGGIVATQGAARCPERVAALVYVAAFLPKDGQSLLDLTKLPEGPPCCVPLLLRCPLIGDQNPVGELHHWPQTRMAPHWLLPLRRNRTYQGLPNHPPMNTQLPCCSLDRPGSVGVLPSDLFK